MKKHLYTESISILDFENPMVEIGHLQYIKKRVQFWKYRKKRTMGRPVLMLWKASTSPNTGGE